MKHMEIISSFVTAAAALVLLSSTSQSNAQASDAFSRNVGYRATGDDGIPASPKVRQFLNERGAPMDKTASNARISLETPQVKGPPKWKMRPEDSPTFKVKY